MKNLQKMIVGYMVRVTLIMVVVIFLLSTGVQMLNEQSQARDGANIVFYQIEHMLEENNQELVEIEEEYRQTCINNAIGIAYLIQYRPEVLDSVEEFKKIAEFTEVDEIHIFDKTGTIVMGTHTQYFGLTMDSGEQIAYFKPMLTDKSLQLCQDISPNTAEEKMMQYSAVWSEDGEFILQIGMEPANVMKVREKNELSYIFSMLRVNPGVSFLAIDKETGEIVGSTDKESLGHTYDEIGLSLEKIEAKEEGFHATVKGVEAYCIFKEMDGNYVGRIVPISTLYGRIPNYVGWLFICLLFVAAILVVAVSGYVHRYVIQGIDDVNNKLRLITKGDLDESVEVLNSVEFSELSSHINEMIQSLLSSTEKMSYILDRTTLHIGVYEHNKNMKRVRFTKYIATLLSLKGDDKNRLASDYTVFKERMNELCKNPSPNEAGVYLVEGESDIYIKVEETTRNNDVLGIVIDVTDLMMKRRQVEAERDMDILTGLFNRRGLDNRLAQMFAEPEKLGCGALIMIDADGLKGINDKYGHEKGDLYLRGVSDILCSLHIGTCIAARQGGDEFVLFLYGYDTEEEVLRDIGRLEEAQDGRELSLDSKTTVDIKFSMGYSLTRGRSDYETLIKQADARMYENKAERKKRK